MPTIEKRTSKNGQITFRVHVRLKGHPGQSATFRRLTDARKWAQKTEAEIRDGRYFPSSEARKHTLSDLIDKYKKDVMPNKKPGSKRAQNYQLDWWDKTLGAYTLDRITPPLLAEQRDRLTRGEDREGENKNKKRSPATVGRYLAALSHAFTIAMQEWQWVDDNPFRKVSKPREPRGRVRFLSKDELKELLKACRESTSKDLYCAVVVAISTGCRKGELMNLRWPNVDLERGLIIFEDTKNDERRSVPLKGHAHELMEERSKVRRIDSDFVFPGKRKGKPIDLTRPWRDALKSAKIKDFKWHDLRHSCASYHAMNGATPGEIAEVLGHKTLQMVKRYTHYSDDHIANIVASMNKKIFPQEESG